MGEGRCFCRGKSRPAFLARFLKLLGQAAGTGGKRERREAKAMNKDRFENAKRTIAAAAAALVLSTACVGAAIGPAAAVEDTPLFAEATQTAALAHG
ncbi:MAG: hypothetical protein ACFBQW_02355 [Sphingomonadaceae bacterium]